MSGIAFASVWLGLLTTVAAMFRLPFEITCMVGLTGVIGALGLILGLFQRQRLYGRRFALMALVLALANGLLFF